MQKKSDLQVLQEILAGINEYGLTNYLGTQGSPRCVMGHYLSTQGIEGTIGFKVTGTQDSIAHLMRNYPQLAKKIEEKLKTMEEKTPNINIVYLIGVNDGSPHKIVPLLESLVEDEITSDSAAELVESR